MVGLGGGAPGPSFGLNAPLQQGRFNQSEDINFDNSVSTFTGGYSLPMRFHTTDTPDSAVGMHDPVSAHIPLKVKEKIWRGEYIHFGVLLKSAKELAPDSMLDGDLVLKVLLTKSQILLTIYIIGQQLLSFIWIYC
jgi:hypothetical protein